MKAGERVYGIMSKRNKRRGPGVFYLFISVGLVVAVGVSFGMNVLAPRTREGVPKQLGNLELTSSYKGAEAMARVNRLHGLDIDLVDAFVAEYTHSSPYHGNSQATVWVGRTESNDAGAKLTERMRQAIGKGGSGFGNIQQMTVAGHDVFQVDGPGGKHFFYNSWKAREEIIWATIEAADALPILEEVAKNF